MRPDPNVPDAAFRTSPQFFLYPNAAATPTRDDVVAFLRANEIEYLFVDALHQNSLVPDAVPVAISGDAAVLRVPED